MESHYIALDYGKKRITIPSIRYIKSEGNYSQIELKGSASYLSSFTLKVYSQKLATYPEFFLPKRGLLININYLRKVYESKGVLYAVLKNGERLNLSRRKGKELIKYLALNNSKVIESYKPKT